MPPVNFYRAVYALARAIPTGQVATYGAVATWLGASRAARAVGYALAADSCGDVPWHRIVNHRGQISEGGAPWRAGEQKRRLRAEGHVFDAAGAIDLSACSFAPSPAQVRRWLALGDKVRAHREGAPRIGAAARAKEPTTRPHRRRRS